MAALGAPQRLVHLLLFLVRYLPNLREDLARQRDAMRARAFAPTLSRHAWRSFGNLVGMLLVRTIERAERVDEAMRCRGFSGRFPLRAMKPMGGADARFAALAAAGALALLALDRLA
jgi:cobalt/nickel transport system permease protein